MIKTNFNRNYEFDPIRTFNFTPFLKELNGISIYYGIDIDDDVRPSDKNFKVKINLETPNFIYSYNTYKEYILYDLILHLCPYTCNYLNKKYDTNKYKPIFFPSNPYIGIDTNNRSNSVFYTGSKLNIEPINIIYKIMDKYIGNDRICSLNEQISSKTIQGYYDKLNVLNNTKICLVHNLLSSSNKFPSHTIYINDTLCKEEFPWHNTDDYVPQLKSRTFEGALMGCILLVFKDKYNTIESYFDENIDFIYFNDYDDLDSKVSDILGNYESYRHIAENARNKVLNKYMIKNIVDIILENKIENDASASYI